MLDKITKFKKIDAHSHVGYFGGWSDVGITPEEMIRQMDEYNVEKTVISTYPMKESIDAVDKYPDRLVGAAWVNPTMPTPWVKYGTRWETTASKQSNFTRSFTAIRPMKRAFSPSQSWPAIWIFLS